MKVMDYLILLGLILFLSLGIWLLWLNLPAEEVQYRQVDLNLSFASGVYSNTSQFYPRMRYKDKEISYWVDDSCDSKKKDSIFGALFRLMDETDLVFKQSDDEEDSEIEYLCSREPSQERDSEYYVAGEGGPIKIINTSNYFIILKGEVVLYSDETCPEAQVALHETLHALGFDHNKNESSILYPITNCKQVFDNYLIDEINGLYSEDSLPDLIIESLKANRTGDYLNFEASISNIGLDDANGAFLVILEEEGDEVKEFDLKDIEVGVRRKLSVENLKLSSDNRKLVFKVGLKEQSEIDESNNIVTLVVV